MAAQFEELPVAKSVVANPTVDELYELTAAMPNARWTEYSNLNVETSVLARSKNSTYLVTDEPARAGELSISRAEGERIAGLQDEFIAGRDMVLVEGFIGVDLEMRVPIRLFVELANVNVAGMQQVLYFDVDDRLGFEPRLTVIDTPNLRVDGYPDGRVIAVDLDAGVTRVISSDYFGESKKGGLRMWNKIVYERGGLPLHAGCKQIPINGGVKTCLIVGLSGTGKTTTTFTKQCDSLPVQDDFVALMPDGRVYATEAGCFAKTYGLDPENEPTIFGAVTSPGAYMENVAQNGMGVVDFFDSSRTSNGRAVFPMSSIAAGDARRIGKVNFLLILNRNQDIIPAVARLSTAQAAAYFMLGETQGTSAGGKAEEGKFLRVPGTNPFFPMSAELQGNRFLELAQEHHFDVYLMNTGRVGGPEGDERSEKVRISHSSAIVAGIAEGSIEWVEDPDFVYHVAASVPGIAKADEGVLRPRELYSSQKRRGEYEQIVECLHDDRASFLGKFQGLDAEIAAAI